MSVHEPAETPVEWLPSSGGAASAVTGYAVVAVLLGYAVAVPGSVPLPVVAGAALGAVLMWAALLRPKVGLTRDTLVLRGAYRTTRIPLAAVQHVAVRRMLVVFVGDRRYTGVALGRSRRTLHQRDRLPVGDERAPVVDAVDYAEDRILVFADDARRRAGVKAKSRRQQELAETVRADWAWPEVVATAVTGVAFLVTVVWSLLG